MVQKKQFGRTVLAACFAMVISAAGSVSAAEISITPEYWHPEVNGNTKGTSKVDFKDDLDFKSLNLLYLTLAYKPDNGPIFYVKNEEPDFKTTKALPRSFSFNGGSYMAGDMAKSELKVKHFEFGIRNEKAVSNGIFSTIYSFSHNSLNTGIQDVTQNFKRTRENTSNSLGVGFGWESTNSTGLNFFAEATVLSLGRDGGYNDYKFGIKSKIAKEYDLCVGYKGERLETYKNKALDYSKADLKGVFVTVGSRF